MNKNDFHLNEQFRINLEKSSWKDIQPNTYLEIDFELTATKKMGLAKHKLLTKYISKLDEQELAVLIEKYQKIDNNSKKIIGAHTFTLCIFSDQITDNALKTISLFPFKIFGTSFDFKGSKGVALIVDGETKKIYGQKPGISRPFKKLFKNLIECINETYQISELLKSPKPEETFKKMRSELKKWGFGLMALGALHFVLASVLDPIWGVILILIGIGNMLIPHRALFLVNGIAIMMAALFNMASMAEAGANSGFGIILIIQFLWGVFETRKFKLYNEVKGLKKTELG